MNKELKYCKNPEDLECNENVKHKTKEYIKKYMQKFGAVYKPKEDTELEWPAGPGWEAGQPGRRAWGDDVLWALCPPHRQGCVLLGTQHPGDCKPADFNWEPQSWAPSTTRGPWLWAVGRGHQRREVRPLRPSLLRPGQPDPTPTWVSSLAVLSAHRLMRIPTHNPDPDHLYYILMYMWIYWK